MSLISIIININFVFDDAPKYDKWQIYCMPRIFQSFVGLAKNISQRQFLVLDIWGRENVGWLIQGMTVSRMYYGTALSSKYFKRYVTIRLIRPRFSCHLLPSTYHLSFIPLLTHLNSSYGTTILLVRIILSFLPYAYPHNILRGRLRLSFAKYITGFNKVSPISCVGWTTPL